MSSATEALQEQIVRTIEAHIKPLFKDDFHPEMRVTVLVRFEGSPGCDVLVTSDDDAGIRAIVDRRTGAASTAEPKP